MPTDGVVEPVVTAPVEPAVTPPAETPAAPAPPAATVDYSALTVPDAIKEQGFVDAVRGIAEQHKIPLEAAQGVLDAVAAEAKASVDGWAATRAGWQAELAADKDFGEQGKAHVATWLDTYGSPELRTMLDQTGLGEHPLFLKALAKAGKDAGPAPIVPHGGAGGTIDPYRVMYPNSPVLFQ